MRKHRVLWDPKGGPVLPEGLESGQASWRKWYLSWDLKNDLELMRQQRAGKAVGERGGHFQGSCISPTMAKLKGQHYAVDGPDSEQWYTVEKDFCGIKRTGFC